MEMGTIADILAVLRRERARLFAQYGLKSMAVFGSATRDDFRPDSDVDILIEVERPIGIGIIDLEQELGRIVSRKVDVVMRKAVKPHYWPYIEPDLRYV
jgi:predicted nucleotidyltransferase